jgi:1,4-alpha-glucan branching enzyme
MKTETRSKDLTRRRPARVVARKPSRAIRFSVSRPSARHVYLAGDFNGWNQSILPLTSDGHGQWFADVPLPPGRHEYLFFVDGTWEPDANAESVPNPFGGVNSLVVIRA